MDKIAIREVQYSFTSIRFLGIFRENSTIGLYALNLIQIKLLHKENELGSEEVGSGRVADTGKAITNARRLLLK